MFATATAFGPGFVVAVGYEFGKMWNSWIRAYKQLADVEYLWLITNPIRVAP